MLDGATIALVRTDFGGQHPRLHASWLMLGGLTGEYMGHSGPGLAAFEHCWHRLWCDAAAQMAEGARRGVIEPAQWYSSCLNMIRTLAADHRPSDATHRSDASIGLLREWDRRTVRRVDWRHLYWSLSLLLLFSCADQDDLSDGSMELPAILRELSGMVAMDDRTIACVQDEVGSVFLVDLLGQHACRQIRFGLPGDYEGIALQDGVIWILQSKGVLGQLAWQGESLSVHRSFKMSLEAEFEGLCYDAAHQRLLVLPKGPMKGQKRERRRRRVFAFDLQSLTMVDEPVMTILVEDLEEQIAERKLPAPRRTTRKGKRKVDLQLDGSELLALPSGDLLLLSPKDHLLLRFDSDGGLVATQALDPELLPQPESIALLPDGRLLVGTEGVDADAIIKVISLPQ